MKKLLMFLALVVSMPLVADWKCELQNWKTDIQTGWDVEFRVSSFYPTSKFFRQIYSTPRVAYGIDISRQICGNSYLWIDVDWFDKKGHSVGPEEFRRSTRINLVPVSMGVKYLLPVTSSIDVYAGAGVAYTFLHVRNHSEFVHERVNRQGFGGVVKTGVKVKFCGCYFLDLFGDYLYQRFHFHGHHTEVGGFKIGGGIGASF
jgi:hypothetical protein